MSSQQQKQRFIGIVYVNLASFVWATNMVLGRWLRDDIGPISLSAARFVVASMIFAVIIRTLPPAERRCGNDCGMLVLMALTGVVLFSPVLYWGLHYTTAINCILINALAPMVTGMLAVWLLREPFTRPQIAGAVLGFCGVVWLVSGGSLYFWREASLNIGDVIVLVAVVIWGFYSVVSRKIMHRRSALSATALSVFIGTPLLCVLAIAELQSAPLHLTPMGILAVIYIGAVPAAIGFSLWNEGLARLGPNVATAFVNTLPLYGVVLGYLFLNEPLGAPHIIGGLLIVAGGVLAAWKKR